MHLCFYSTLWIPGLEAAEIGCCFSLQRLMLLLLICNLYVVATSSFKQDVSRRVAAWRRAGLCHIIADDPQLETPFICWVQVCTRAEGGAGG